MGVCGGVVVVVVEGGGGSRGRVLKEGLERQSIEETRASSQRAMLKSRREECSHPGVLADVQSSSSQVNFSANKKLICQ